MCCSQGLKNFLRGYFYFKSADYKDNKPYKLKNFSEAKLYLEKAIILMPQDPIVNDHFADCLWMNNNKIQARYFWKNVLKLKNADKELKNKVEKKLLLGLQSI